MHKRCSKGSQTPTKNNFKTDFRIPNQTLLNYMFTFRKEKGNNSAKTQCKHFDTTEEIINIHC